MKNYIFFPLDSSLLPLHIGRGIIQPSIYSPEGIKDIQSHFPNYLFFSTEKWLDFGLKNDCCMEIILTSDEIKSLNSFTDFALLSSCIPISRIKKIHFKEKEQMNKAIFNIEQGDGFIPNICDYEKPETIQNIQIERPDFPQKVTDLSNKITLYDQILGGFACMRLAGRLSKKYQSNFAEGYFATLSQINEDIKQSCEKVKLSTKSRVAGIFFKNAEITYEERFLSIISAPPKSENEFIDDLKNYDKSQNRSCLLEAINSSLGIEWSLLGDDSYLIALALLSRYGNGKRKSTSDLFNDFVTGKIPFQEKLESLLFIYGFHYGYSHFRKSEKINKLPEPIKFEMNSQLDYLTIESIYQYSFYNKSTNRKFEYLDKWCPKYSESSTNADIYILDVPIWGLPLKDANKIYQNTVQKIVSFFLDSEKTKFSKKTIIEMEKELTIKVESLLGEMRSLQDENNKYRRQITDLGKDKTTLLENIASYERELILYQNKIKDLQKAGSIESSKEDVVKEPTYKKENTINTHNRKVKKVSESKNYKKSSETSNDRPPNSQGSEENTSKTYNNEVGDLFIEQDSKE